MEGDFVFRPCRRAGVLMRRAPCVSSTKNLPFCVFPNGLPPTVVSADFQTLSDFHRQHGGAVIKPLDGMGGRGVVVSPVGDKNLRALIELVGDGGRMLIGATIS